MKVETDNEIVLKFLLDSYESVKDEKIIMSLKETIETIIDSVFLEALYDGDRKELLSNALSVMLSLSLYMKDNPNLLNEDRKIH
jgi:hypothetical protein